MSERSAIEWTDSTFNPWMGCTKVGPGCDHCYAEALIDQRYGKAHWGAGQPRVRTSASNWHGPVAWNRRTFYECLDCGRRFAPPQKDGFVTCPGCGKFGGKMVSDEADASRVKQVRRRVFCASLADVFDNEVDPAWRADLFRLISGTPKLDWLLLTKRVGNVERMMKEAGYGYTERGLVPLPANIWLGATVVNQEEADRDIPKLLAVPARVRFLSIEPMLGPVDLAMHFGAAPAHEDLRGLLHWVIAGGESGPQARPLHIEWVESLLEQCKAAGVPCLVKQLGHRPLWTGTHAVGHGDTRIELPKPLTAPYGLKDPKGGDINEWPERLRVRQFPEVA